MLIGNWLRMDNAGNDACFREAFYKRSNNLFAWSGILENVFLPGGVRRKWSMAALTCHLSSSQTCKNTSNKHSVLPLKFFILVLVPPGLASHSVKVNIVFVT